MAGAQNVSLTIVCRKEEWASFGSQITLPENIKVKHLSGKDLEAEYFKADLSLIVLGNHPYRRFCMPLKLFEAIAYDTPVIMLSSMNAASNFLREHNLGYVISSEKELVDVFKSILNSREEFLTKVKNINEYKKSITWAARAGEVNARSRIRHDA